MESIIFNYKYYIINMLEKRICPKCGKEFDIDITKSNRKFCSRSCANAHKQSNETKEKISKSIKEKINRGEKIGYIQKNLSKSNVYFCKICGKELIDNKSKFCSNKCKSINNFIKTLQKYFKLDSTKLGTFFIFDEIDKIKNTLFNLYWNENKSSTEICEIYNYPNVGNLTGKIFKYLDISTKSCKDINKETCYYRKINESGNINYIHGWHKTWNNNEVYLRSSFEFGYAKYLDNLQILYDVECLRIKYFDSQKEEFRCAIPDFYLPETNTIVEIKSDWTLDKQNMIDKFNEYKKLGYNVKLILNCKEVDLYSL